MTEGFSLLAPLKKEMTKLKALCQEYSHTVQHSPGVSSAGFIGSMANCNFVPGKSDIDVFGHRHKIPRDNERGAIALVRQLNAKYQLGLGRAPYQHPTPGHIKRALY